MSIVVVRAGVGIPRALNGTPACSSSGFASVDTDSDSASASAAAYGSEAADADDEGGGRTCASVVGSGSDTSIGRGAGKVRAGAAAIERNEDAAVVGADATDETALTNELVDDTASVRILALAAETAAADDADAVAALPKRAVGAANDSARPPSDGISE